jgi:hypothetical protein
MTISPFHISWVSRMLRGGTHGLSPYGSNTSMVADDMHCTF